MVQVSRVTGRVLFVDGEKGVIEDCRDGNGLTLHTVAVLGFIFMMIGMALFGLGMVLWGPDTPDEARTTVTTEGCL